MTYDSSACILYSQILRCCALPSYEPAVLAKDNLQINLIILSTVVEF